MIPEKDQLDKTKAEDLREARNPGRDEHDGPKRRPQTTHLTTTYPILMEERDTDLVNPIKRTTAATKNQTHRDIFQTIEGKPQNTSNA